MLLRGRRRNGGRREIFPKLKGQEDEADLMQKESRCLSPWLCTAVTVVLLEVLVKMLIYCQSMTIK